VCERKKYKGDGRGGNYKNGEKIIKSSSLGGEKEKGGESEKGNRHENTTIGRKKRNVFRLAGVK